MDLLDSMISLKISGSGIRPESFKFKEISEQLSSFESAMLAVIARDHPNINIEDIKLSLVEVKEGSAKYVFKFDNLTSIIISAYVAITGAIKQQSFHELPYKAVQHLELIQRFTVRNDCNTEFLTAGNDLEVQAAITPQTVINVSDSFYITGETTLYGILIRVGGKEPTVAIEISPAETIYIKTNINIVQQLTSRLYEEVALKGVAKWLKEDYTIDSFKIEEVLDYRKLPLKDAFSELRHAVGNGYSHIDDIDEFFKNLRED